ncbi:MAG: Omp28-related outer membrane protein [Flavobacteriaceae bacterium]|nr:Omp28-related outer membrane protein [Flavobacteriaceae bacterium]
MNSKLSLPAFILTFFLIFLNSCSKSSDNDPTNSNTSGPTSISIVSSTGSIILESQTSITINVIGDDNINYSNSSTIYVNDIAITGNTFTPTEVGTLEFYAKKGDLTSNSVSVEVTSGIDGIVINISQGSVKINNNITFIAKDNFNNNITSEAVFYVNGAAISGSTFNTSVYGTYEVYATYSNINGDFQSETVSFDVYRFTKKALVEDYTGTWCGYCPRLAYNLEQAEQQHDEIIGVGIHSGDVMETSYTNQLESEFGINSWPNGRINRTIVWNESVSQILAYLNVNPGLGLGINSSVTGNTVSVDIKIDYDLETNGSKLVVYLLEDGLIYPQTNYYNNDPNSPWYQTGNPISDFEHNNVLIASFTNIFGDTIPDGIVGQEFSTNYSISLPSNVQNTSNLEIVAFVVKSSNGTVINVQHSAIGVEQDFD